MGQPSSPRAARGEHPCEAAVSRLARDVDTTWIRHGVRQPLVARERSVVGPGANEDGDDAI
jgi:hypothetical protein